jgi:putative transposase
MDEYESLSHKKWEYKYHVVFIPKRRRKTLHVQLRPHLGEVFRRLAQQKESRIEDSSPRSRTHDDFDPAEIRRFVGDWVHQGKSAIHLARVYGERKRNFVGQHFWARGYIVSTVGREKEVIRECIQRQQEEDARLEQLNLWR